MILQILDRGSAWAAGALFGIGVRVALPALLMLVTLEVVLRYGFNSPLQWSRDVNGLLLLTTLFSALPHAWDRGYHIRMEIVHSRLRGRWRSLADGFSALAGLVFFGLMGVQAVGFARYMFVTGETGEDLSVALWPFMVYVAVCGLVLCARLVAKPEGEPDAAAEAVPEAAPGTAPRAAAEAAPEPSPKTEPKPSPEPSSEAAHKTVSETDEDAREPDRWI